MEYKEYLNFIREENKKIMSVCHFCDGFAINIKAEQHRILPVCKNHIDERDLQNTENEINKMFEQQMDFE